jgi:hypothetical protein
MDSSFTYMSDIHFYDTMFGRLQVAACTGMAYTLVSYMFFNILSKRCFFSFFLLALIYDDADVSRFA